MFFLVKNNQICKALQCNNLDEVVKYMENEDVDMVISTTSNNVYQCKKVTINTLIPAPSETLTRNETGDA